MPFCSRDVFNLLAIEMIHDLFIGMGIKVTVMTCGFYS